MVVETIDSLSLVKPFNRNEANYGIDKQSITMVMRRI